MALLVPVVAFRPGASRRFVNATGFRCQTHSLPPREIALNFSSGVKGAFAKRRIRLQYFTALDKFLKRQNLDAIGEMDGYAYQKLGRELRVTYLVVITVSRFELTVGEKYIAETGNRSKLFLSDIECLVEVRNVEKQGDVVYQETFAVKQDLRRAVDRAVLRNWTVEDCGRYAILSLVEGRIAPWLDSIKEFGAK